jgi:hypothetical protein
MTKQLIRLVFIAALGGGLVHAGTILYSIGGDNSGVPRVFTSIPLGGAPATLFNLGDGSAGFNGGLTYRSSDSHFYAISNDNTGFSTLDSFALGGGGVYQPLFGVGFGFTGGLTYDSADGFFYAISNDQQGFSTLNKISLSGAVNPLFGLGFGFMGGLTFDPLNGLFYAISGDMNGVPRVFNSISLGGVVAPLFSLGDGSLGFNGGLAFNSGDGLMYVISNDGAGNSTLKSFALAGGPISSGPALGQGFNNAGLALVVIGNAVPEPSSGLPLGVAFLVALYMHRRIGNFKKERL